MQKKRKNSNDELNVLKSEYLEKTFYISREKNFYIYIWHDRVRHSSYNIYRKSAMTCTSTSPAAL